MSGHFGHIHNTLQRYHNVEKALFLPTIVKQTPNDIIE